METPVRLYDEREYAELTQHDLFLINAAWLISNGVGKLAEFPEEATEAIGDAAVRFRALSDLLGVAELRLLEARKAA